MTRHDTTRHDARPSVYCRKGTGKTPNAMSMLRSILLDPLKSVDLSLAAYLNLLIPYVVVNWVYRFRAILILPFLATRSCIGQEPYLWDLQVQSSRNLQSSSGTLNVTSPRILQLTYCISATACGPAHKIGVLGCVVMHACINPDRAFF